MAYHGGGVVGPLHPSLRAYIDCFKSSPLPKMYPRGGGPWDQDPILMRDFRVIRELEIQYKQTQEQLAEAKNNLGTSDRGGNTSGGLEAMLDQYIENEGLEDVF